MLSMSYKIRYDMTKRNEAIAILTGGGPAPGMNTVVGSVVEILHISRTSEQSFVPEVV